MDTPARPQKLWEGQLVDIDDDAYEAWVANGCPTEPPAKPVIAVEE